MEPPFHDLSDLFRELGLPDDPGSIERFIAAHRGLPAGTSVCDAPFWTATQARFLREGIGQDADWAEVIDTLSVRLCG